MPRSHASSNARAGIAALGPLVFGYTLGFTSPSNLAMESSAKNVIFHDAGFKSCDGDKPPCA